MDWSARSGHTDNMSKRAWTVINTPEHLEIAREKVAHLAIWYYLKGRQVEGKTGATRQELLEGTRMSATTTDRSLKAMYAAGLLVNAVPEPKKRETWAEGEAE